MEDDRIVELYWARDEAALNETSLKYGSFIYAIAQNVLSSAQDSEECVNDTYLNAWNSIPPARPSSLKAFLAKIVRNLALDRWRTSNAKKRGEGNIALAFEEMEDLSDGSSQEDSIIEGMILKEVLEKFVDGLDTRERRIFLKRYWYFMSINEIAADLAEGESKVKMTLLRLRRRLKEKLEEEGVSL